MAEVRVFDLDLSNRRDLNRRSGGQEVTLEKNTPDLLISLLISGARHGVDPAPSGR
jgi:hypothetical protein